MLVSKHIVVHFNNLTGLGRCPISHTCNCTLESSISYATYPEFEQEFLAVFQNENSARNSHLFELFNLLHAYFRLGYILTFIICVSYHYPACMCINGNIFVLIN